MEEPVLVDPHNRTECTEVPLDLLGHVWFLDFDSYPLFRAVFCLKFGAVYLGDTCTRGRLLLEDLENTVRSCRWTSKLGLEHGLDGRVGYLWCVVEKFSKVFLHWARKEGCIIGKGLALERVGIVSLNTRGV